MIHLLTVSLIAHIGKCKDESMVSSKREGQLDHERFEKQEGNICAWGLQQSKSEMILENLIFALFLWFYGWVAL